MRIAVIFQDKKFIVVVSDPSTVDDLKAEIERVYSALFPSSSPPQAISEIRTLAGCVLYGGYTVSSVLADSDTIAAVTTGDTPEVNMTQPMLDQSFFKAGSSPLLPFYGINPMGYHSSLLAHMMSQTTSLQNQFTPSKDTLNPGVNLFPSSAVRNVGTQFPSPRSCGEGTNDVDLRPSISSNKVTKRKVDSQRKQKSIKTKPASTGNVGKVPTVTGNDVPTASSSQVSVGRKRKLSGGSESDAKKVKSVGSRENVAPKQTPVNVLDNDSSGWTSSDDTGAETHSKKTPSPRAKTAKSKPVKTSNSGKKSKPIKVTNVSRNTTKPASVKVSKKSVQKLPVTLSSSKDDSSSEWESESAIESAAAKQSSTSGVATRAPLYDSQTTDIETQPTNLEAAAQSITEISRQTASKVQSSKEKTDTPDITISSSSSEWSSDDEACERGPSWKPPPPPLRKKGTTSKKVATVDQRRKVTHQRRKVTKGRKTAEGKSMTVNGDDEKRVIVERNDVESDHSVGRTDELLKCWSLSPGTRVYTACDGQRLKWKKREEHSSELDSSKHLGAVASPPSHSTSKEDVQLPDGEISWPNGDTPPVVARSESTGEILAPNSVTSDEGVTVPSQPHDGVTVVEETQETRDSSRSVSPEIPFLGHSDSPQTQHSSPLAQKLQDDVILHHCLEQSTQDMVNDKQERDLGRHSTGHHTDTDKEHTDIENSTENSLKLSKTVVTGDKCQSSTESTSGTVCRGNRKHKKRVHSSKKVNRDDSLSCDDSDMSAVRDKKKKGKTDKDCVRTASCDVSIVPSSQTDGSADESCTTVAGGEELSEKQVDLSSTEPNTDTQKSIDSERYGQQEAEMGTESTSISDSKKKKKSKHKKSKKRKSKPLPITDRVPREMLNETSTNQSLAPSKDTVKTAEGSSMSTDNETTDFNTDSVTESSQGSRTYRHKTKRKHRRKETTLIINTPVISKEMTRGSSLAAQSSTNGQTSGPKSPKPTSSPTKGKIQSNGKQDTSANTDDVPLSLEPGERTKDGFLKPVATLPKKSLKSTMVQLSPAAKLNLSESQPADQKKSKSKGSSLLSVFSVTETEPSSDEECAGSTGKDRLKDGKGKRSHRTLNFLSSLASSHGKKLKPARRSIPFCRTSLLTPSSHFTSEKAMRMFSLSHTSPRTTAALRRAKLHSTPISTKPSSSLPSKQRYVAEELNRSSLDDMLKETGAEVGEGGEGPSVSELLEDGSLWDT